MSRPPAVATLRPAERRERAFLRLLADMCRHFPDLREWLLEDFVRDPLTRENFETVIESGDLSGEETGDGFAEVSAELDGWLAEKRRLQAENPAASAPRFGGLTWDEMEALVRCYEARTVPLTTFLLARDWRHAGRAAKASPRLLRGVAELVGAAMHSADAKPLVQFANAVQLVGGIQPNQLRVAFGYSDWWKLHAALYMLRHPREAYRTRVVRAHLAALQLEISAQDFRRFCKRHGIRRDERAGRPRKHPSAPAAHPPDTRSTRTKTPDTHPTCDA